MSRIMPGSVFQGQQHLSVFVPEDGGGEMGWAVISVISTSTAEAKGKSNNYDRKNGRDGWNMNRMEKNDEKKMADS